MFTINFVMLSSICFENTYLHIFSKIISKSRNVNLKPKVLNTKPKASEVLTCYLKQICKPQWTSYFVRSKDVINDQFGMSNFNWEIEGSNYVILRTGCFPYIKYHCTKAPKRNVEIEDKFYRFIKMANLGIPCLVYGISAWFLIKHKELVHVNKKDVYIYFLIKENRNSTH